MTYSITFGNVGEGRAYGVYVSDQLADVFDASTLTLLGGGTFVPSSRSIFWTIGELGPKDAPDSEGAVTLTVRLRSNLPNGTVVLNQAVVHFPSVPSDTPTNPVVNVVEPLVALPQSVQTSYAQPVALTLQGVDAGNAPLTYNVLGQPLHGTLGGIAPNLVYTPMLNFNGPDEFSFKVSNGISQSRPALVAIMVNPSAADTTPPQVSYTIPPNGATNIHVSPAPVFTDSLGPTYHPVIVAQFSEPISSTTVSTQTVTLKDLAGHSVAIEVVYDAGANRLLIMPHEVLRPGTFYRVRVANGIKDLAGNNLPADVSWTFQTAYAIYLPVIER